MARRPCADLCLVSCRKRFSAGNLVGVTEGSVGMSASSREGGDEYSSEASEHDTYGTVRRLCLPNLMQPRLMVVPIGNQDDEPPLTDVNGLLVTTPNL